MGGLPGQADGEQGEMGRGTHNVGLTWWKMSIVVLCFQEEMWVRGRSEVLLYIYLFLLEENFGRA